MTTTATAEDVLTGVLAARWKAAAAKFADLAAAIPDDKFESQLAPGTRTCGEVLRHVAYWNRYVGDSLNGKKADDSANELSPQEFPDKSHILSELKKTSQQIASGIGRKLDAKAMESISMGFEHLSEHYGQLAVYARLLGITPPASRS